MSLKSLCLLSSVSLVVLAMAAPTTVAAQEAQVPVSLPAGPLQKSLVSLARQAGFKILFETELVAGLKAPSVEGRYTPHEALERLLVGTGIRVEQAGPGVVVLRAGRTQVSLTTPLEIDASEPTSVSPQLTQDTTMVAEIVVGSHIRGVKETASPVIVLGRADIERNGYASVAEALTALPQAFGGTASEDSVATGADNNGTNFMRSTGLDLRGLGADATLVLFNGKRMAGAGVYGDFADISSIPFAAVGRVDVLLDGASALYGADAVGGVVDIRLRTDLNGAETRISGGTSTQGGYWRELASQAFGKTWSSGHVLAAYEFSRNRALHARDRDFASNADLRPWGGTDWRSTNSQPANILRLNAAGAYVATYAVPTGQNGIGLKPTDFVLGTVNLQNQKAAYDLLPESRRHSAVVSASQDVGPVELTADLRMARREIDNRNGSSTATIVLTAANPYYVSPTGQASERIAYSFQNERGGVRNWGVAESLGATLGAKTALGASWHGELSGTYAQELGISRSSGQVNSTNLSEAAGLTADSPLTKFSAARDGYFNPYIAKGSNPDAVLDFILAGWDISKARSEHRSANLGFDGPLMELPGGLLRLALGGQLRQEKLRTSGARFLSGYVPTDKVRRMFNRDVRSLYAELNAPIVGPANALPLVERLEVSVAARLEDYDDVGSTKNPKIGVIWAPNRELTFKATYGTSFRAPALYELHIPYTISPISVSYQGGVVPSLVLSGGNPDLRPETAKSWTTGLTYTPQAAPELTLGLTAYRTLFKNRVGAPVVLSQALTSAEFAPFRTFVSPATNSADRARVEALMADSHASGTGAFDASAYGAIIDIRNVNTGSLDVSGLDANGSYKTTLLGDPLALNANLSWLMHYKRMLTPVSSKTELAGRAGYPADLRARVSATWTRGAVSLTTGVNHVGDTYADTGRRVHSWTTFDLQGRWQGDLIGAKGLTATLNVQNLFDKAPPFYDNPLAIGYDPANADPLGRMVSFAVTKAW